ncbi:MAG TPA: hypothetical protein VJH03_07515 [Blastocatellia bacterium]|nr:hypothetical protein [Blastocatellia bacterium]
MTLKTNLALVTLTFSSLAWPVLARAQGPVTTVTLGPDQIGFVRTAQGITTRISFTEDVTEIICGDLYDPASGKGGFVVQRSGSDVFVKPIASKGMSNLFVKTGEGGKHTFNFDLLIVPTNQANRVVNVIGVSVRAGPENDGAPPTAATQRSAAQDTTSMQQVSDRDGTLERRKAEIEQLARHEANEILRSARQQAARVIAEAEAKLEGADKQIAERSQQESENRFVRNLLLGIRESRIASPRAVLKKVVISLDPRVLTFDDRSYLRYTIQNTGDRQFSFSAISLEAFSDGAAETIPIEIAQSKSENLVAPGESLAGVITFDSKQPGPKARLTLYFRGEDNIAIARLVIQ